MIRSIFRTTLAMTTVFFSACSAQMLIEDDTIDEGPTDNAPDCPASANDGDVCSVAEGQICSFHEPDELNGGGYNDRLCGCWEASTSERRWYCYYSARVPWECPSSEPANGQGCFGLYGAECMYPERSLCSCSPETGAWSCFEDVGADVGQPPASVPENQPIDALTDEERAAWCDWFVTADLGPGFPEPAPAPPDENGYSDLRGCALGWELPCLALLPTISSDECEANLRLSSCAAPISELTDCVTTVHDSCWPSPHGCARYFERPNCGGTIAVRNDGESVRGEESACKIRVR